MTNPAGAGSGRSRPFDSATGTSPIRPWPALWAMVIGFFMVLVDMTIVSVANPAIKAALDPHTNNLDNVVWVTSAYLLAYAVPLLVTGRMGDRYGPRNLYLIGLSIFTLASLGCGLSPTLGILIIMRAVQGIGAALMMPQTMAVITRSFPPNQRGAAMGLWGGASGVAMLVGPLAGGLLVDSMGWEWIFFINLPVGVIGFVLAWILVPKLETHRHRFDSLGMLLSAVAMFLIVFGLQEGEQYSWGTIWGPVTVWGVILAGVAVLGLFVWQQSRTAREPLLPLVLFRDRSFAISSLGIAVVGFVVTAYSLPAMFYIQLARGLSPTQSALLLVPMAVLAGVLSPFVGKLIDRIDPRFLMVPGLLIVSGSLVLYAFLMRVDTPVWLFLIPAATLGLGSSGMWGPLATSATRNLPRQHAGAGSGIYNTTRTIGSALGSAAMAAFMQMRLSANLPDSANTNGGLDGEALPTLIAEPFATAMAQAILLPAAVMLVAVVAVCFLPSTQQAGRKFGVSAG